MDSYPTLVDALRTPFLVLLAVAGMCGALGACCPAFLVRKNDLVLKASEKFLRTDRYRMSITRTISCLLTIEAAALALLLAS